MATTSADIVNRALEIIGSEVQISGSNPSFDGSVAGDAAGVLYAPTVQLMLRQLSPAFARNTAALAAAAGTVPPPWTHKYTYPTDCMRVRSLRPAAVDYLANNPLPIRWAIAFDNTSGANKVIVSNQASAWMVYTTDVIGVGNEEFWDDAFAEVVARRLSSPLAMALAGRPDFARELLQEAGQYGQLADLMDER